MKKILLALTTVVLFAGSAVAGEKIVEVVNQDEVFQKGYIQVIGESEAGQSRYRAKRAAEVVAQRRMLEIFQGLRLSGQTTVRDGMLASEKVKTTVDGTLRGAVPCGESFDRTEGYARVCLRLNLHGHDSVYSAFDEIILKEPQELKIREIPAFKPEKVQEIASIPMPAIKEKEKPVVEDKPEVKEEVAEKVDSAVQTTEPASDKIQEAVATPVDGIIVDVRDFDFKPALVNRILTEKNEVLFDPSKVLNQVLIERGCGGYTTDLQKARALLESWGSKSPMVLKGKTVQNVTDAVVSVEDASTVFAYDQKYNLLAQARVVFVLK
ncbi:hypothetical protein [Maridesulfovibrio salexigens]|uniref:LPP20 lipoprotein n=1 Tax=Maridesulfovibrio salexigens (strain ATCC 14822 / DSM 2638 / NCIMB 8403 / VKM B-1763) TaxID=526222 RepID=C6BXD0_MARSD|nr:hypothetical protein [Maridesulfovibrio salexigens]ACS80436.1 protein of unknown function DUF400 [Maridesulfovibrio salexigens DSM 2638]